jgi:DNA-binding XRE family transcriptional regulator
MNEKTFIQGNDRIARLQARPGIREAIETMREESAEAERVYAMSLAMIREAGQLTQVEVSKRIGMRQGTVSKIEHNDDMLLSTLRNYLEATGATNARITVTVKGTPVEIPLDTLGLQKEKNTPQNIV